MREVDESRLKMLSLSLKSLECTRFSSLNIAFVILLVLPIFVGLSLDQTMFHTRGVQPELVGSAIARFVLLKSTEARSAGYSIFKTSL